jgi:hypothetical protein
MTKPSKRRRSEVERLVDLTVLGPTHPELGTCWLFTGTTTPYGRIAKAQDSYTHRLGWKLLRGPIPEGRELQNISARFGSRMMESCGQASDIGRVREPGTMPNPCAVHVAEFKPSAQTGSMRLLSHSPDNLRYVNRIPSPPPEGTLPQL